MSVVWRQSMYETLTELLAQISYEPMLTGLPAAPMVRYVLWAVKVQPVTVTLAL